MFVYLDQWFLLYFHINLALFHYQGVIWLCSTRHNVRFTIRISQAIGKRLQILALLLQVLFCNPQTRANNKDVPLVK